MARNILTRSSIFLLINGCGTQARMDRRRPLSWLGLLRMRLGVQRFRSANWQISMAKCSPRLASAPTIPKAQLKDSEQLRHLLDLNRRAAAFSSRPPPPTTRQCYERFQRW